MKFYVCDESVVSLQEATGGEPQTYFFCGFKALCENVLCVSAREGVASDRVVVLVAACVGYCNGGVAGECFCDDGQVFPTVDAFVGSNVVAN